MKKTLTRLLALLILATFSYPAMSFPTKKDCTNAKKSAMKYIEDKRTRNKHGAEIFKNCMNYGLPTINKMVTVEAKCNGLGLKAIRSMKNNTEDEIDTAFENAEAACLKNHKKITERVIKRVTCKRNAKKGAKDIKDKKERRLTRGKLYAECISK